ncbi:hypothetical protein D3C84_1087240 [compost metagenome]
MATDERAVEPGEGRDRGQLRGASRMQGHMLRHRKRVMDGFAHFGSESVTGSGPGAGRSAAAIEQMRFREAVIGLHRQHGVPVDGSNLRRTSGQEEPCVSR